MFSFLTHEPDLDNASVGIVSYTRKVISSAGIVSRHFFQVRKKERYFGGRQSIVRLSTHYQKGDYYERKCSYSGTAEGRQR